MTLYIATSNAGKLSDFQFAAAEQCSIDLSAVALRPIPNLQDIPTPAEDAPNFEENAVRKAVYYSAYLPGEIVISDDSGLEVEHLGGEPGVRSARYAQDRGLGPQLDGTVDKLNNDCLLRELLDAVGSLRRARYRCALAASRDRSILATSTGVIEGRILEKEAGSSGFGYDPLFFTMEAGCTMAQVDPNTRMLISHRGRALRAMLAVLKS